MNYDDFVRELSRSPSHASLSSTDLEDMAKKASAAYLVNGTPLNDAVVKVAQERPGMSTEQVKRVVEMANTATFQNLFEKCAGDRNVQFVIADPSEVLRRINSSVSAPTVKVASAHYTKLPSRASVRDLEADMSLCETFGVTPRPTPAMEKAATIDPARGQAALEIFAQREQAAKAQKKVIEMQMQPPEPVAPPTPQQLGMQPAAQGAPMQAPPQPAPMMGKAAAFYELTHEVPAPSDFHIKEAMAYVKMGRPDADLVRNDLASMVSLDAIKTASASRGEYPNRSHTELMNLYHGLKSHLQDVASSLDEVDYKMKVAQAEMNHHVIQHLLQGGNLGEVVHLMQAMGSEERVKEAMISLAPEIEARFREDQILRMQTNLIQYEMTKSASSRVVDDRHPLAQAYAGFLKLAATRSELEHTKREVEPLFKEAKEIVTLALKQVA